MNLTDSGSLTLIWISYISAITWSPTEADGRHNSECCNSRLEKWLLMILWYKYRLNENHMRQTICVRQISNIAPVYVCVCFSAVPGQEAVLQDCINGKPDLKVSSLWAHRKTENPPGGDYRALQVSVPPSAFPHCLFIRWSLLTLSF